MSGIVHGLSVRRPCARHLRRLKDIRKLRYMKAKTTAYNWQAVGKAGYFMSSQALRACI